MEASWTHNRVLSRAAAESSRKNLVGRQMKELLTWSMKRRDSRKDSEVYLQAFAYEIPIHQLHPLFEYPFAFAVDLEQMNAVTPSYTLISLHRLHISDLMFAPLSDTEVDGCVLSVCIRQWQLFSSVCLQVVEEEEKEDEINEYI